MVADFEAVSMAMSQPDADLDALTNKMTRLQVWWVWLEQRSRYCRAVWQLVATAWQMCVRL
jgi:hypothetical protein